MSFADTLQAKKPILRLGRVRLRFDVHMLVGEYVPPLGWRRFAPELAMLISASAAVGSLTLLLLSEASGAAYPLGALAILAALATVRLELQQRARQGFVFNYATRTLRIDRATRLLGSVRTLLIPFSGIAEAGVTQPRPGRYALEVELKPGEHRPGGVEVLLRDIPPSQLDELFRISEMARAAFGLAEPKED